MPPPRRVVLSTLLSAFAAAASAQATNTLLFISDDVGIDSLGAYRAVANPPPTPNLDQLARGGVLFRNMIANPMCSTTRATIHTGRYSFRTGIGWIVLPGEQGLRLSEHTLPEILSSNGTTHALIGKWHLGEGLGPSSPNLHGWSHYAGALGAQVDNYFSWPKTTNGVTVTSTTYATTETVNDALTWIGAQTGSWVCAVAFNAAHSPLHAPPQNLHTQNLVGLDPGAPLPFFKAMIEAMDTEIGRLLASLPAGVLARTNVIFVGDNGTPGNVMQPPFDPRRSKGSLYEGGTKIPLIVSGPAVSAPGREVTALVNSVDVFASVAELQGVDARARVPANVPLDSISFVPYLRSASQTPLRTSAHAELFAFPGLFSGHAVRDARWKLHRFRNPYLLVEELYDLAADPHEQVNLWDGSLTAEERAAYEALRIAAAGLREDPLELAYGSGCSGSVGVPTLTAPGGGPRVGAAFTLRVGALAPAALAAVLFLGTSRTSIGAVPLPIEMSAFGMPTCHLNVSGELVLTLPPPAQGQTQAVLTIPTHALLIGAKFFFQGSVVELGANQAGVIVTPGIATVVGR